MPSGTLQAKYNTKYYNQGTVTGTLKTAIDRLYTPLMNGSASFPKETVLLLTSGGSIIDHMLDWYKNFESWLKRKDIGNAMNDTEKAKEIDSRIS